MKLFDIIGGKVQVHADMLALPPFKKIWDSDKSKDKQNANKALTYIILKNYFQSPYVLTMDTETIGPRLRKEIWGNENYKISEEVEEAEKEYIDFTTTITLRLLQNARNKLNSISKYYENSLDDELNEKKIKDILAGMASLGNTIKSLDLLESNVKSEEIAMTKVRGGSEINPYELNNQR